jgi:hypothetical protein
MAETHTTKQSDLTKLNIGALEGSFPSKSESAKEKVERQLTVLDEFETRRRLFFEIR